MAKNVTKLVDNKYLLIYDKSMANQIKPKWYEPRKCFRSRKTINGKVKSFYGGSGGSGSNDQEAYAQAVLQIKKQIDAAQCEVDAVNAEVEQRRINEGDAISFGLATMNAKSQYKESAATDRVQQPIPLMVKIRELQEQVLELEKKNSILTIQLAVKNK